MDARGEPRSPSWFELVGGAVMDKLGRDGKLAELCEQAAKVIRENPDGAARVADRLALALRAPASSAK